MLDEETREYKLFISHIDRDDEEYDTFLSKLEAAYDFQWTDTAVRGSVAREDIQEQLEAADVVVILSGLISKDKEILTRMIDTAKGQEKPIVVVRPYGMEIVPSNLEDIASEVVGWNTPCIVDAIHEALGEEEDFF